MTTDRPREIVIHQSANRPNQILGGDRELVLVTILVSYIVDRLFDRAQLILGAGKKAQKVEISREQRTKG